MNEEDPSEAHATSTNEVVNGMNDAEKFSLEEGAMVPIRNTDLSVKDHRDPRDPGMVSADRVISSPMISAVQKYCQTIQINAKKYSEEEKQKLACLFSNISNTLNSKSNLTQTTATVHGSVNPVKIQSLMEHEDIEEKVKIEIDEEMQQLLIIKRDLRQELEVFHIMATTPLLEKVGKELTAVLDEQPFYLFSNPDVNASNDPDTKADSDSGADRLAPPKRLKTANVVLEEVEEVFIPLEEQVFGIHLVAKAIFKKLDTKSLKNLRVVSKTFNYFATEILQFRQSLKICIINDIVYLNNNTEKEIVVDLDSALDSLTNSIKLFHRLPTDHLGLFYTNLEAPALKNFLNQYGYLVKTLELSFRAGDVSILAFRHLLLHQVVNLETLFLGNVPVSWGKQCKHLKFIGGCPGGIRIRSLNTIKMTGYTVPTNVLRILVFASVNLRQVKDCSGSNFLAFLSNGNTVATALDWTTSTSLSKLHLMKTLIFDPSLVTLTHYSKFLAAHHELRTGLQIQKLQITLISIIDPRDPRKWPRLSFVLTQLLQMSAATLEKLVVDYPLGFLEEYDLQLPTLPNVIKVNFNILNDYLVDVEKNILPSNCQISHAFPNVQHLEITFEDSDEEEVRLAFVKYFGNPLPIPSLKTLELVSHYYNSNSRLPLYWLEQFCALAPNLKVANFGTLSIVDFHEASKIVWTKLLNLQKLTFSVCLDEEEFVTEGCMDVAFTGFSKKTCKRLRKQKIPTSHGQSQNPGTETIDTVVRAEDWKDKRENPSILDLKSLTSLTVDLFPNLDRTTPYPVFLSWVAGLYAFKMCDKLKVSIEVDTSSDKYIPEPSISLESILPYVSVSEMKLQLD